MYLPSEVSVVRQHFCPASSTDSYVDDGSASRPTACSDL